jgi:hypothetical protein
MGYTRQTLLDVEVIQQKTHQRQNEQQDDER